jgi:hypothetical protein
MSKLIRRGIAIVAGLALPIALALPAAAADTTRDSLEIQWKDTRLQLQQTTDHARQIKRSLSKLDSKAPARTIKVVDASDFSRVDEAAKRARAAGFTVGDLPDSRAIENVLRTQGNMGAVDMVLDVLEPAEDLPLPLPDLPLPGLGPIQDLLKAVISLITGLLSGLLGSLPLPLPVPGVPGPEVPGVPEVPGTPPLPEPGPLPVPLPKT